MEIATEPLGDQFWKAFWSPFGLENPCFLRFRAAKKDFGGSQDGGKGKQKMIKKWVPKKIALKSYKNPLDGSEPHRRATDARPARGRRAVDAPTFGFQVRPGR